MSSTQRDFSEVYSHRFEDLQLGTTASVSRTVSEADILMFAGVSGDTNPVHLDQEFAASTMFGGRIAHGMLSAGLISAVFGTRLPGPGSIYLSQTLKFKAPVKIGDTLCVYTEIARVGRTSMTLKVETWAQRLLASDEPSELLNE